MAKKKISYLSLIEASQISKYNPDYLGYLIRAKKLGGKKIGRDWFTTREALEAYLTSKKYISLEQERSSETSFLFSVRQEIENKGLLIVIFLGIVYLAFLGGMVLGDSSEQGVKGDFGEQEKLQEKRIFIGEDLKDRVPDIKKLNITTYSLDEDGEIEVSMGIEP